MKLMNLQGLSLYRIKNDEKPSSKTLKQKRTDERKASEAAGNTKAWNSLFMRPDTVSKVEN